MQLPRYYIYSPSRGWWRGARRWPWTRFIYFAANWDSPGLEFFRAWGKKLPDDAIDVELREYREE